MDGEWVDIDLDDVEPVEGMEPVPIEDPVEHEIKAGRPPRQVGRIQ